MKNILLVYISDIGYPNYPKFHKIAIQIRIRKTGYPEISDIFESDFEYLRSDFRIRIF